MASLTCSISSTSHPPIESLDLSKVLVLLRNKTRLKLWTLLPAFQTVGMFVLQGVLVNTRSGMEPEFANH